jgi:hypothetical protein
LLGVLVCASLFVLQLAVPGPAAALPRGIPPGTRQACPIAHIRLNVTYSCASEFMLHASNGYKITVSADPEARVSSVELMAEGPAGTAQYVAPGHTTATTIRARFGRLGSLSVRFRPSGHRRRVKVPKRCLKERPPVVTSRLGSFVGTIRFRGEHGYTRVSADRAEGGIGDPLANIPQKLVCDFRESEAGRKRELESVSLDGSPPGSGVSFLAARLFGSWSHLPLPNHAVVPPGPRFLFLASAIERTGKMSIFRYTGALGGPEDFVYDPALASATLHPPAPFTGSGSFLRSPDGTTVWSGSLAAALPGLGKVRLTGGKAELATLAEQLKQSEERLKKH